MAVSQFTSTTGVLLEGVLLLNGTADLNGIANALILDADGDTHISAPTNNQIDIAVGGADDFTFTTNAFNALAGSSITGAGSTFVPFVPMAVAQAISGAGAINITTWLTKMTTTAANAFSLADGAITGQLKKILMVVDAGDATLTPTNLSGGTTITFADAGDFVILMWNGTAWVMIESGNMTDGVTAPVLA